MKTSLPEGREMRAAAASVELEYRADNQQPAAIVGQAIVCGVRSVTMGAPGFRFVEIISARALDGADISEVEGVFNHNSDILLGHTRSGTMTLTRAEDGGLRYHIPFDAEDPDHQRVSRKIKRGDVTGSSFVFDIPKGGDEWAEERAADGTPLFVRTVNQFRRIYDVCPVTNPAYLNTTTAKRSLDAYAEEHPAPAAPTYDLLEAELALKSRC